MSNECVQCWLATGRASCSKKTLTIYPLVELRTYTRSFLSLPPSASHVSEAVLYASIFCAVFIFILLFQFSVDHCNWLGRTVFVKFVTAVWF